MAVRLIAKDSFPHFAVASWASRAEAHETVTAACQREATASGLFRLIRVLGVPTNGNKRHWRTRRFPPRYLAGVTS